MKTTAKEIIVQMFEIFGRKDIDGIVNTFTDDAVLIHHGTQIMPSAKFVGKAGARLFFEYNLNALEVVYFNVTDFIESDNRVIVFGNEHFISKADQSEMKNTWVQIYTVHDGLIAKMEEFATSASPEQYVGNA